VGCWGENLQRFKIFRRIVDVPECVKQDRLTQEYRANVKQREITIAFALDKDGNLSPHSAGAMYGGVYSFLPLGEARSGAKFPIQADFLVQPGRDAVNYEAPWNRWLLEKVTDLCREAIGYFKEHPIWKYQFMQTFDFTKSPGRESYEKLFGPYLIEPLETFLLEDASIPTADGGWAKPEQVVWLKENTDASQDLITMGLFTQDEIAPALGGRPELILAHPEIAWHRSDLIREVDRWDILNNEDFLREKARQERSADWFRTLYLWLGKHPVYESYWPKYARREHFRVKGYHDVEFILTADSRLLKGGLVSLLDLDTSTVIKDLARSWQASKDLLHPEILAGAKEDEERKRLRGFLTGLTGVQIADSKDVCKEVILPLILTHSTDRPSSVELVKHTIFCQRILGWELERGTELWVLTKQGDIRTAKEVYFSSEFKPEQDWERYQRYLPGLSFISTDYLADTASDEGLPAWREFFKTGGVRESPDNGVEDFAVNYAVEKLQSTHKNVTVVEKRRHGWDIEAESESGDKVTFEVKGQSTDRDVELKDNEADAADKYGDSFYLCVVSSIPNNPMMYLVRNPARVGKKDKITIPIAVWKGCKID